MAAMIPSAAEQHVPRSGKRGQFHVGGRPSNLAPSALALPLRPHAAQPVPSPPSTTVLNTKGGAAEEYTPSAAEQQVKQRAAKTAAELWTVGAALQCCVVRDFDCRFRAQRKARRLRCSKVVTGGRR